MTVKTKKELGKLFKDLRKEKDYSIRKAAEIAGINHSSLLSVEAGAGCNITTLFKLMGVYDVEMRIVQKYIRG